MQNKLAIFDFDGTLFFDTFKVNKYAINKVLETYNLPIIFEEQLIQTIGDTLPDIAKRFLITDDENRIDDFCNLMLLYASEYINEFSTIKPSVIEMLKTLHNNGITLCICSNGAKQYLYLILKKFNMFEFFDTIWYAKKDILKSEAVKLLRQKYKPNKCIMVGDREEDILAGSDNDCITIGITDDCGQFTTDGVENFDLSNADYLASSHIEVSSIILAEFS